MLDTMPYADFLAIYNAIAEKPVTRFDTRATVCAARRPSWKHEASTLPEAARIADVVLGDANSVQERDADR